MSQAEPEQTTVDFERRVKQRHAAPGRTGDTPDLQSVLSRAELKRRPSRPPDLATENRDLIALAQEMAASPDAILQKLADTALVLCRAHSAVLSLLEEGDQKRSFHWRAVAGQWAPHLGGGTPRDFGPCGTVLDRNVAVAALGLAAGAAVATFFPATDIERRTLGAASDALAEKAAKTDHGKGNSRAYCVADYMIDARPQTGTAPDEQTEMRYPTRASELDHRRLQVPPSPLHDPSPNQLHAGERGERPGRACGA